jgi:hypothetical protein
MATAELCCESSCHMRNLENIVRIVEHDKHTTINIHVLCSTPKIIEIEG